MGNPQPSLPLGVKPPRKKMEHPEEVQQRHLFRWLRLFESREPRFKYIHGSMNGLPLFGKVLTTAWATGLRRGIWDVFCPGFGILSGSSRSGLYIELKATYKLTDEQAEFRDLYQDAYAFVVAKDWLTAARAICEYLGVNDPLILEAIR